MDDDRLEYFLVLKWKKVVVVCVAYVAVVECMTDYGGWWSAGSDWGLSVTELEMWVWLMCGGGGVTWVQKKARKASRAQQQSDPSWSICHIPRPRVSLRHTHSLSSVPSLWPEMFATISSLYYAPSHFFCFYHLNSDDNSLWGDSQNPCVVRSRPKSNSYGFDNQPIIKIFEMTSKKICTILKICALPTHLQQSSICYRYELCLPKYVFFLFFSLCLIFL